MRRFQKILLIALGAGAGLFLLVVAAWAVDSQRHGDRVVRNVDIAGIPVGGMTRAQLQPVVARVAERYNAASIYIVAPEGSFVSDSSELGVRLQEEQTINAIMRVGRSGGVLHELGSWIRGVARHRRAPVHVTVNEGAIYEIVPKRDPGPQEPATEPTIKLDEKEDKLVAVEGKPGKGIDPADVIEKLPAAARKGVPIKVKVRRGEVEPRFDTDDAEQVAERATALTKDPLAVRAGAAEARVPVKQLRSWLRAEATRRGLVLAVKPKEATGELAALLPKAGTAPTETRFNVVDGVPKIIPGKAGTGCCALEAAESITKALEEGRRTPVALPLTRVEPTLTVEAAEALKIKEPIGSFTTQHKCCEARVTNIHRIADLARGHVIKPGETYSINERIGRRTREKGFVTAGVIQDGVFAEDVGGGVSQFATTLFNAAFFGGLDFGEYQSHSLYISRYPYGREATMGFPHPDLQIKNTTPYGVLVWPSYTSTSITVTLYSTKFATGEQTGQSETPRGPCKRVSTERTRRYVDGRKPVVDRVFALYRPGEGVNCPSS